MRRRTLIALLFILLTSLVASVPPAAAGVMLTGSVAMRSDPGDHLANDHLGVGQDYFYKTGDDVRFYVDSFQGGIMVRMENSAGKDWRFDFAAPENRRLTPGTYRDIQRFPFQDPDHPGMTIVDDAACSDYPPRTGSFTVVEAAYDGEGQIQRLELTFEHHCYGMTAALRGHLRLGLPDPVAPFQPKAEIPAAVNMNSDAGAYVGKGGTFRYATQRSQNVFWYRDRGLIHIDASNLDNWSMNFSSADGEALGVGRYGNAARWPFNDAGTNGMSVVGMGSGCNRVEGSFDVLDVHYDDVGQPDRLHLTFEHRCEGAEAALRGEIRIGTADLHRDPTRTGMAWGDGQFGAVGTGSTSSVPLPSPIATSSEYREVAAGMLHSLATTEEGYVETWGYNGFGQLGTGSTIDQRRPVKTPISGVTSVSAGFLHSVALKEDGTVWTWGNNSFGQLGTGPGGDSWEPKQVPGLKDVKQVSAGGFHTLALKADGTVWAWGWNGTGALGDGSLTTRQLPVKVDGISRVRQVAAGGFHSLAIVGHSEQPHTVWVSAWGWNVFGQVGDGTKTDRPVPVQIDVMDVKAVTAGLYTSHALSRGTLKGWGWNALGQIGDGTTTDRLTPKTVYCGVRKEGSGCPIGEIALISTGGYHSVAVDVRGQVWSWGWNGFGQLGDGSVLMRTLPVEVQGPRDPWAISAGWIHTLAVDYTPAL